MAAVRTEDLLGRLRRLDRLVAAFGHILVSSELERPLPSVIPLLVSQELSEAEAGGLIKEILRRGGAALVSDLEELERVIRGGKKDPAIFAALREVRLAFRQTAHLQAGALARKIGRAAQAGVASDPESASLQKELEAFISGVAHAVREDEVEFEEVFADEDLLVAEEDTPAPPPTRHGLPADAAGPPDLPRPRLYKEGPQRYLESVNGADRVNGLGGEQTPSTWNAVGLGPDPGRNGGDASLRPPHDLRPEGEVDQVEAENDERPLEWLRGRIDVYNEMLARWGAGEAFVPQNSPLVRRGTLDVQRCTDLYRELLAAGAIALVDRFEELERTPGYADDWLRYMRSRIAEGLAAAVPRILALLASGEPLPSDLDNAPGGHRGTLAALSAYLGRAADLFDESSPSQARLRYLSSELRSAIGAIPG
ncbi:MAG TPA: hypothetical protein VGR25_03925 [bacterium]|jgi:hypothetical protein|nr:hypothetical protein [bacterium]